MLSAQAVAQGAPVEFRMVAAQGNPSGCRTLDASMSRVHTVTVTGDKAALKSSGGINDTLKQTQPGIYKTTFSLSGARLEIVANTTVSPKTLEAVEPKIGCHWNAVAP